MKQIQAYGCIPFMRTREQELVACMVCRVEGFWEFPKGKGELGESPEETAVRELKEETGLEGILTHETPLTTMYQYMSHGEQVHKDVTYFFCRVPDGSSVVIDPQEISTYVWLPLEALPERATYSEMKDIAQRAWQALAD